MLLRDDEFNWDTDFSLDDYQHLALASAIYENPGKNLRYTVLGLCEEAGEVAGQLKKMERDDGGVMTDARRLSIKKEIGDALWYVAAAAKEAGFTLSEVAAENLKKLADRKARGVLRSGSDR